MFIYVCIYKLGFPFCDLCMNSWVSFIPLFKTSELDPDEHG